MASKLYKSFRGISGLSDKILKNYDPVRVHYYNYWIFVLSGFWKYESPKRWKTNLYKIYQRSINIIYGISLLLFFVDAVMVRKDLSKLFFNLSSSVLVVTKLTEIFLLSNLKDDVETINDKLNNHFNMKTIGDSAEDKSIIKKKAELMLKTTVMFYSLLLIGLPLRVIADTALDTKAYLIPMPFKEKLDPYYEYVYAQQVVASFHFMMTTLSYDLLGFSIMFRFISYYEILEKNFLKIKTLYPRRNFTKYVRGYIEGDTQAEATPDVLIQKTNYSEKTKMFWKNYQISQLNVVNLIESEKSREEKTFHLLLDNLHHHQRLLREVKNFFSVYSRPLLFQALGMAVLIGIATLQLFILSNEINPLFLQQFLYASTTLINIYYLCTLGSELTNKSIAAANALYDTPWYDMSINNRNVLFLMMKMLYQAPKLKGGDMINIDRPFFVKFLQSSYNMVALLRNKI